MHTAGPICVSHFIKRDMASAIYTMVMLKFSPVFCIYVSIAKGMVNLT